MKAAPAGYRRPGGAPPAPDASREPPDRVTQADDELIMHLERDQFVAETSRPVAAAVLRRRSIVALWGLRVFAVAVSLMVIYTFIAALH
jgi:hypothetical protein